MFYAKVEILETPWMYRNDGRKVLTQHENHEIISILLIIFYF